MTLFSTCRGLDQHAGLLLLSTVGSNALVALARGRLYL